MDPRARTLLIAAPAAVCAVFGAASLAGGDYVFVGLLVLGAFWLVAEWAEGPLPEAYVLAVVLVGYILGNRGFAQLSLSSQLPLLPAETALIVCLPALVFRAACRRAVWIDREPLTYLLLCWIAVGAARLPLDLRVEGAVALRDFAMIYYAAFFFVGQGLATHANSTRFLSRALTFAFLALPPIAVAFRYFPNFFMDSLTLRGIPIIFHKGDLIATSLAAGFFWLWAVWEKRRGRAWLALAAISLGSIGLTLSPRAAMVATVGVTTLWLAARRWRMLALQGSLLFAVLVVGLGVFATTSASEFRRTPFYSVYEHAISIVDVQGKGTYWNRDSGDPGGNNRFRLVWWNAVYQETMSTNPAFGLGFGHDLSRRFLADYEWLANEEFSARSPHSMLFTVLGRMGVVGLGLWLLIAVLMARKTWVAFRSTELAAMSWWSVSWTFWLSSCFGVVLEGPMGAVIFWTSMGIGSAMTGGRSTDLSEASAPRLRAAVAADEVAPAS